MRKVRLCFRNDHATAAAVANAGKQGDRDSKEKDQAT